MKKIFLIFTTVCLSSCDLYNTYKPADTVSDDLYGKQDSINTDTLNLISDLSWKEMFTDPKLQTLIELGLQNNTNLQSAQWRIKEAEASLSYAKLSFLPSFALAPQGTISSFENTQTMTYSLPINASWEVDIFGKILNAKRRAKAVYLQSKEYEQAVRTQLVAGIANTYYTLLMLDCQLKISETTKAKWAESVETTRAMKEAGMVTEAALSQTEATYYAICSSLLDLKENINQVENSLSLLLAETPSRIERGVIEEQVLPDNFSIGIPIQLLSNRPDVKVQEQALAQAFYGVNSARAAFYPSLVLGGSVGWVNNAGSVILNPGKLLASAVGSLTQPLFNKGLNRAQLKIAKAQLEEASLSFQQTLLNAGSEVNNNIMQYQTARNKTHYYAQQIVSLQRAVESTQLLMQHGNATYLEVLAAQQSLLNAQLTQVSNRFKEMQGVVNLYQALGGGQI